MGKGQIANRQWRVCSERLNSRMPFRRSTWNEYYTNGRQSRDSNHNATNAGSTRTKFYVFRVRYDRQLTLAIQIAEITLGGDSAITRQNLVI